MVPPTHCAERAEDAFHSGPGPARRDRGRAFEDPPEPGLEALCAVLRDDVVVDPRSDGELLLDREPGGVQALREVLDGAVELDGEHGAPDVHADRSRDDGRAGRDHGPDGGSDPHMQVRHGGDVRTDARELRGGDELLHRVVRYIVRPYPHGAGAPSLDDVHGSWPSGSLL